MSAREVAWTLAGLAAGMSFGFALAGSFVVPAERVIERELVRPVPVISVHGEGNQVHAIERVQEGGNDGR